jgi:hypothetical protein
VRRTSGPENFQASAKKDFFNTIDPELTSTAKEVGQINALHINSEQFITAVARWHS